MLAPDKVWTFSAGKTADDGRTNIVPSLSSCANKSIPIGSLCRLYELLRELIDQDRSSLYVQELSPLWIFTSGFVQQMEAFSVCLVAAGTTVVPMQELIVTSVEVLLSKSTVTAWLHPARAKLVLMQNSPMRGRSMRR